MSKLNCEVVRDLLPLYEDGVASGETQAVVQEHLKDCPACREELRKMRTPVSLPPEREEELWERFQARRARVKRKRTVKIACAAVVIGLIALFCLWYTRPQTWADITGEDAAIDLASLTAADPDWNAETAAEKLGYLHWQLRQDDAGLAEAGSAILQTLGRYTFRASLGSLIPRNQISLGWRDDLTLHAAWGETRRFFYVGDNGRMVSPGGWGYAVYHCDPALFEELAQIIRTYGTLQED